jgi:hypothetical protein
VAADGCAVVAVAGGDVLAVMDLFPEMYRSVDRLVLLYRVIPRSP